jgi:hypothetical protein
MKKFIVLMLALLGIGVWIHKSYPDFFKKEWGNYFNKAQAQEDMIPASRVKDAMRDIDCKQVSFNPAVWTCEHARAFCIVLNPSNQAQLQCQFR